MWALIGYLSYAVAVTLSGVLSPGPMTAAVIAAGSHRRHAGAWICLGHIVVELPVMMLLGAGAGTIMKSAGFRIGIGLAGGSVMILLAGMMAMSLRRGLDDVGRAHAASPVWTGMALTGGNPYFLLWWATVGMGLATGAMELGAMALVLFALLHWLCDLIWFEVLSVASHSGARWLGAKGQRVILIICALAMTVFGARFIWAAAREWA